MKSVGVIHGRFQPLHRGHMEYILAGKERCDFLYIGLANPDPTLTRETDVDRVRSGAEANFLNYWERYRIVTDALVEAGVSQADFGVVPFPINVPEHLRHYVPLQATFYMTIYDEWDRNKRVVLGNLGCRVEVMWERTMDERLTSGTEVRKRFLAGKDWEQFVMPTTASWLKALDARTRLLTLANEGIK